jgi:hypothetical protein
MKTKAIILLISFITLLLSCSKKEEPTANPTPQNYSFAGKVQKGPYITGTMVTLNELNSNLGQTGRAFTTTITADDGSFSLKNVELNTTLCLLTANGFYFGELYGKLSPATLSLQAIADLNAKEKVNINLMTHVIKGRLETIQRGTALLLHYFAALYQCVERIPEPHGRTDPAPRQPGRRFRTGRAD